MAFFLTFDTPSSVLPLAADPLLLAPAPAGGAARHSASRPIWSGVAAGVGFMFNTKAVFVLASCAVFAGPLVLGGFVIPCLVAAASLAFCGAWHPYIDQVWIWSSAYATKHLCRQATSQWPPAYRQLDGISHRSGGGRGRPRCRTWGAAPANPTHRMGTFFPGGSCLGLAFLPALLFPTAAGRSHRRSPRHISSRSALVASGDASYHSAGPFRTTLCHALAAGSDPAMERPCAGS